MQPITAQKASGKRLWSKEEDDELRKIVSQLGDNMQWAVISQKFNEKMAEAGRAVKRTNKQCRERWQNHLNPALSNNAEWSLEEHHMLFTLLRQHSQQWSQISAKLRDHGFGCRSDNHIKNYFYSSIKKAIKRINEILRNRNRLIKKQKSIMLNYNEKYAYQRHLSLQRQVQISSNMHCRSSTNVSNSLQNEDRVSQIADLKIIKELDQEIVRKILLIAESKGAKKFTISYKKYQEDAISTRDRLIDFIQNDSTFQDEDIINLASQILQLSKKCKRKSRKNQSFDDQIGDDQHQYRETHHANTGSEEFKKNVSRSIEQNQKYSSELKQSNILQDRLLCEQQIIEDEYRHKKVKLPSKEFHLKLKDELQERAYNTQKNMFLDQSNHYLFGSDCYFLNDQGPHENEMINNDPLPAQSGQIQNLLDLSYHILQCNQSYELPLELLRAQNVVKLHANSAEFEFLNSIKELNPSKIAREHEQLFNFDMNDDGGNPFFESINSINCISCERGKIFGEQFDVADLPHANFSLNKEGDQQNQYRKKVYLNRSWAYSSSLLEIYRIADLQKSDCIKMRNKVSAPL